MQLVAAPGALEQQVRQRAIEIAGDDADDIAEPERWFDRQVRPLAAPRAQRLEIERGDFAIATGAADRAMHGAPFEPAIGDRPQRRALQALRQMREVVGRLESRG